MKLCLVISFVVNLFHVIKMSLQNLKFDLHLTWTKPGPEVDNLGAGVFIQRAGANSSKVCGGAGVYMQGAGVYR